MAENVIKLHAGNFFNGLYWEYAAGTITLDPAGQLCTHMGAVEKQTHSDASYQKINRTEIPFR